MLASAFPITSGIRYGQSVLHFLFAFIVSARWVHDVMTHVFFSSL
jgi:hypothetical protein